MADADLTEFVGKKVAKVLRLARRAVECHVDCQTCKELLPDIDKALADLAKRIPSTANILAGG